MRATFDYTNADKNHVLLGVVPWHIVDHLLIISFSAGELKMLARNLHMISVADFDIHILGTGLLFVYIIPCWRSEFLVAAINIFRQLWPAACVVCDMNQFLN